MSRARRLMYATSGLLAGGVVVLLTLAWSWLPSQEEVAERVAQQFHERTGVQVDFSHAQWTLWPQPTLVVENAVTRQASPIILRNLRLRATWSSVLQRAPQLQDIQLEGGVVPLVSLHQLRVNRGGQQDARPAVAWLPGNVQLHFRELTWIDRRGIELDYEGSVDVGEDGLPDQARIVRSGSSPATQLRLQRQGQDWRWRVLIDVPGGTWNGSAELARAANGRFRLTAELVPKDVDVEALLGVFRRHSAVSGRANGSTTIEAEAESPTGLAANLHTSTRFVMKPARLTRFDLAKAVRSAGTTEAGQTPLDELSGTVDTQSTGNGIEFRYTNLLARSGVLKASGNVRMIRRKLDGELAIDLVDGVVGIPLKISGTVEEPVLSMTTGAVTGAAVGTAVLPGVGTAIGARVGQQVERLLGGDSKATTGKPRAPQAKPAR
ncbi:MAG: hypothetical protein JSS14_17765 [Proteobacteria bacterium]|nr:hypothetical protein [Pseudomonadota bacterium]